MAPVSLSVHRALSLLLAAIGAMALTAQPGALDASFDPGLGANDQVSRTGFQGDGRIIAAGAFTLFNGSPAGHIVRLNTNGSVDATFLAGSGFNGSVNELLIQSDDKILVYGDFTSYNGTALSARLVRLNGDGTLDTGFSPPPFGSAVINSIAQQTDGKILLGGFMNIFSPQQNRVCRLAPDGSPDASFSTGIGPDATVNLVAAMPDGRIFVAGNFSHFSGTPRARLCVLGSDGTLDATFDPGAGPNTSLADAAVLPDGRVVIGGTFTTYDGATANRCIRILPSGEADPSFSTGTGFAGGSVTVLGLEPDGDLLVAGSFLSYNGTARPRICRLSATGSLDAGFDPGSGPDQTVLSINPPTDHRILISGVFTTYNGTSRAHIARLLDCTPSTWFADDDSDGFGDAGDAVSQCFPPNGYVDNSMDCDDNDPATSGPALWYADLDQDGSGDPNDPVSACSQPVGHVANSTDCDDGDPLVTGPTTWYSDADGDDAGDPSTGVLACTAPMGTVPTSNDCNDNDPAVQGPVTWYLDADGDGFGNVMAPTLSACAQPVGYSADNTDCNDSDPALHEPIFWYADNDSDGHGDALSSQFACSQPMGHVADNTDCDDQDPSNNGPRAWYADVDGDGFGDPLQAQPACTQPSNTSADGSDCDDSDPMIYPFAPCEDGNASTYFDEYGEDCVCRGRGIQVSPVIWLEGANTTGSLMRGTLYNAGLIPLQEPYSDLGYTFVNGGGGETTTAEMLNPYPGNDELMAVDWVVVELRDENAPGSVLESRACILRRNGVVNRAGSLDAPEFNSPPGSYYVAIRHRNHLGAMTAGAITINSPTPPLLEFAFGQQPTFGVDAMRSLNGRMMLWAGDATRDEVVMYTGGGNDRDRVLSRIGGVVPTTVVGGYFQEDVNLDGLVKYTGSENDRDVILQTIGGIIPTAVRTEQIPD